MFTLPLLSLGGLPIDVQPFIAVPLLWILLLYLLAEVPPSDYRGPVTFFASLAFGIYLALIGIEIDLGEFNPYFGEQGLGDEALFAVIVLTAHHTFWLVEDRLYRRLVYVGRLHLDFSGSEPRLTRKPPLIETSGLAGPKPPAE